MTRTDVAAVHHTSAAPVWELRTTSLVPVPVLNWACSTSFGSTGLPSRSTYLIVARYATFKPTTYVAGPVTSIVRLAEYMLSNHLTTLALTVAEGEVSTLRSAFSS